MTKISARIALAGLYKTLRGRGKKDATALSLAPSGELSDAFRHEPEGAPINSKFEVRRMTTSPAAELREAAMTLASAFDESPLFRLAFPRAASRNKILRTLFAAAVEDAVRFGRVEVVYNQKIVGMLIWYPPGGYPMSLPRILRLLPHYARIVAASPVGVLELFRAQTRLNELRPKQPHCHGYFLGGRQGEHIGAILIKRVLHEADGNGWPIYLETQEPRCANLYARFGFKMLHKRIETLPGGPLTWTMWREPHTSAQRLQDRLVLSKNA